MRYKNLIGFVWVAVIVSLFTSCLKDINNVYNPGTTAAVVRQHGDSALMMANTRFGWIYATKLSSYSEGKCLLVSFDYAGKYGCGTKRVLYGDDTRGNRR